MYIVMEEFAGEAAIAKSIAKLSALYEEGENSEAHEKCDLVDALACSSVKMTHDPIRELIVARSKTEPSV